MNKVRIRPNGHVWILARQFYTAADIIYSSQDCDLAEHTMPLLMNYAFSCELSLKSLEFQHIQDDRLGPGLSYKITREPNVWGHDLLGIFCKLKAPTRDLLAREFLSVHGDELEPMLQLCKKYFEDSRYSFEGNSQSFCVTNIRELARDLLPSTLAVGKANA